MTFRVNPHRKNFWTDVLHLCLNYLNKLFFSLRNIVQIASVQAAVAKTILPACSGCCTISLCYFLLTLSYSLIPSKEKQLLLSFKGPISPCHSLSRSAVFGKGAQGLDEYLAAREGLQFFEGNEIYSILCKAHRDCPKVKTTIPYTSGDQVETMGKARLPYFQERYKNWLRDI